MENTLVRLLRLGGLPPSTHEGGRAYRRAPATGLLLMALGAIVACGGGGPGISVSVGRSLEIHATSPELVDRVDFLDGRGDHQVIRARASNRQLAVVNVTVVNRTSIVTPLLIDADAARLGDRRGERIQPLNPFVMGRPAGTPDPKQCERSPDSGTLECKYSPFLWGDVELERRFQVQGWMVFDVPKGMTLGTFWWQEVDDVSIDFVR